MYVFLVCACVCGVCVCVCVCVCVSIWGAFTCGNGWVCDNVRMYCAA